MWHVRKWNWSNARKSSLRQPGRTMHMLMAKPTRYYQRDYYRAKIADITTMQFVPGKRTSSPTRRGIAPRIAVHRRRSFAFAFTTQFRTGIFSVPLPARRGVTVLSTRYLACIKGCCCSDRWQKWLLTRDDEWIKEMGSIIFAVEYNSLRYNVLIFLYFSYHHRKSYILRMCA